MKYTLIIICSLFLGGCEIPELQNSNTENHIQQEQQAQENKRPGNQEVIPPASIDEKRAIPVEKKIDLSHQGLEKVPGYIFEEKSTEELDLSNNQLTGAIPAEIRQLQNLRVLNLSNNSMTGVPAEAGQLQYLEILDLSNNELTGLPYELGNLKNLKRLNISGNAYSPADVQHITEVLPSGIEIIK